jgi:hypothetical protein
MAALFHYDRTLPVPRTELPARPSTGKRQLEVYTFEQEILLRLSPVGQVEGESYTVRFVDRAAAQEFADGFQAAIARFGWD